MAIATCNYEPYSDLEELLLTDTENCYIYRVFDFKGELLEEVDAHKRPFDKKCNEWSSKRVLEDIKEKTEGKLKSVRIEKAVEVDDIVSITIRIDYWGEIIPNKNSILVGLYYDEKSNFKWVKPKEKKLTAIDKCIKEIQEIEERMRRV